LRSGFSPTACLSLLVLLSSVVARSSATNAEPSPGDAEFFEKEVRPLLVEKCLKCHGDNKPKGGLRLTSQAHILRGGDSGPAVVAGKPEESLLIRAVRHADKPRMPPREKLTGRQIDVLARWVKRGLPWPAAGARLLPAGGRFTITEEQRRFWSFQPVKAAAVPAVRDTSWPRTPVDRFILAALEANGLRPAGRADKRTLLRRVTFDLIGLPPTPAEIDDFLADDSPQAFARVVDRLLASPAYGERWGRHWLDVVRYADARDLIQLPPPSDFREAWRYRDWVVGAFNRDLPYRDFLQYQLAGDLLQPNDPEQMNADALVATGMLAIADFVPGDVDKELMIADYVNDQIDVVGRAFMGLTLACARCHDHKFDPVSTEDYYGLAGIFFSTRLIPGPVPGNTPLVRVPLMPRGAIEKARAKYAASQRRRAEIQREISLVADRESVAARQRLVKTQTARYLVAACEYKSRTLRNPTLAVSEFAREEKLNASLLGSWVDFLGLFPTQGSRSRRTALLSRPDGSGEPSYQKRDGSGEPSYQKRDGSGEPSYTRLKEAASGKLDGRALERFAEQLQQFLVKESDRREREAAARTPEQKALAEALLLHFQADDPLLRTNASGQVVLWPDRSSFALDAAPVAGKKGPLKTTARINGRERPVVRFSGELLEARRSVPPAGSLFVVYTPSPTGKPGQRLVGWEDSAVGQHGLGVMLDAAGNLHAILRNNGASGDIVHARTTKGEFEILSVTWGEDGTTLHRGRAAAGASKTVRSVSSDPAIKVLRIGGPGSGGAPRFQGDVAEIRVYNRQMDSAGRARVEAELHAAWFSPGEKKAVPVDPIAQLYDELVSPRGPFRDRTEILPANVQTRIAVLQKELATLKTIRPLVVPEAVVVQDGGPKGTKHEGFRDAHVYLRGNHKTPGKKVPRRFPAVLAGDRQPAITKGSGRLELARWLSGPNHPLAARVMVNRLWQHHFGEGIVRTANNFGERGERPTHPELLDYLADRFVKSGWSVKDIHRVILLSSVYQQSSRIADGRGLRIADSKNPAKANSQSSSSNPQSAIRNPQSVDPDNRLFGRMNRRRLDAEAIRDSLLAVAGRLERVMGGPAFAEMAVPRRTLYLMSARTGANTSGFASLFDRADPGSIVEKRSVSTVAPQALFFLNDPFVTEQAAALAGHLARDATSGPEATIRQLYKIVFGRLPSRAEMAVGTELLGPAADVDSLKRYCHTLLCTNEFLFVD
jgi:hypothetical protein